MMNNFILFLILSLFSITCKSISSKKNQGKKEIILINCKYNNESQYHSFYFKVLEYGRIEAYQCKELNNKGLCFQSDSLLIDWICNSTHLDKFFIGKYNFLDSLNYSIKDYDCFFRQPYRFKKFLESNKKDTICVYDNIIINEDSLPIDNGYSNFERMILDSFYITNTDTIYIVKKESLTKTEFSTYSQDFSTPTIYHISRKHILYYKGEFINSQNRYIPLFEVLKGIKIICEPSKR